MWIEFFDVALLYLLINMLLTLLTHTVSYLCALLWVLRSWVEYSYAVRKQQPLANPGRLN